jgi:oligopeptide/dipeptide ABC transporter ATP-binding protein
MTEPILTVNNLTTHFQIGSNAFKVVEDISFSLHRGKTLALVGESGCGKSMTALSIMRILPTPPALSQVGEVIYQGRNLLTIPEKEMRRIRGARIAMIFQDPSTALNPVYTVGDQLLEVAGLHLNLYGDEAVSRVLKVLSEVGLSSPEKRLNEYPHQMSGGMKQRIMIAMALICEPDILIADEPTTALDVTIQAQVLDLIRDLQERKGMALLLITHDMGVVAEMADEVMIMYTAQVMEHGHVLQIFDHPTHPYTMGLFESRPVISEAQVILKPIKGTVPQLGHYPEGCRFHPRCPYVMEKCKRGAVPYFSIENEARHESKCWLYDGSEESLLQLTSHKGSNR